MRSLCFIVDAQLPLRLARWLQQQGYDALHTLEPPQVNRTPDGEIKNLSQSEQRIVITKDGDFVDNLVLHRNLYKLLLVSTGNISNTDLIKMFQQALPVIISSLEKHQFIEHSILDG